MKTSKYSAIIDEGYLFVGKKTFYKDGKILWKPFKNKEIDNLIKVSLFKKGLKCVSLKYGEYDPELGIIEIVSITVEATNIITFVEDDEILIKLTDLYCHPNRDYNVTLRVIDKIEKYETTYKYVHPLEE
jgi:hypothetical protein